MPDDFQYFKGLNPKKKQPEGFAEIPPQPPEVRQPANPQGYVEFAQAWNPAAQAEIDEMFRAFNESGQDSQRVFSSALVGNINGPHGMHTLHIQRGKPEGTIWPNGSTAGDSLEDEYNSLRQVMLEAQPPNPPYHNGIPAEDIGPIDQAWFVLFDDCTRLDPPLMDEYNRPFHDEWNALMNCWPNNALIADIWNRRRMTFAQLVERVRNMVVAPEDPNLKYHWYDRTE
jgi:hypothetical protein